MKKGKISYRINPVLAIILLMSMLATSGLSQAYAASPSSARASGLEAVPPAATLVSPTGAIGATYNPTYTWNEASGATYYYLWVNGPSGNVIKQWYQGASVCSAGTCSATPTTTLAGGDHIWYIQTWNPDGYGPWSTGMSFSTHIVALPGAPVLIFPSGSIGENYSPLFSWNEVFSRSEDTEVAGAPATWYYLYVNGPSGVLLTQWFKAVDICNGVTCSVVPSLALGGGTHTWWVRAYNPAGLGPWSSGMSFTPTTPTIPGKPTLVFPTSYTSNPDTVFTWDKVIARTEGELETAATWYYLWVNGPAPAGNVIKQWYKAVDICNATTCSVTSPKTLAKGTYTWWVQSYNAAGYGPWSNAGNFNLFGIPFDAQFNGSAPNWTIHSGQWWLASNQFFTTPGVDDHYASISYDDTYTTLDFQARLWRNPTPTGDVNCLNVRGAPNPINTADFDWDKGYSFCYSEDATTGYYSVWKSVSNNQWSWIQNSTPTAAVIRGGAWNTLRVVADDSYLSLNPQQPNLYFYINGTLVWSGIDTSLASGRVGIEMWKSQTSSGQLWVDWATLTHNVPRITETVSPEQQALNEAANQAEGESQKQVR